MSGIALSDASVKPEGPARVLNELRLGWPDVSLDLQNDGAAPLSVSPIRVTWNGCNRTQTDFMRTQPQLAARILRNGVATSVLALVTAVLAVTTGAQEDLTRLNGVYLYSPQSTDRSKIERAIEDAISGLGMLKRGLVRNRLQENTEPIPRFQVHFEPERLLLRLHKREFALPLDGRAVVSKGLGGGTVKASARITGNTIYQTLVGSHGTRYHEFRFSEDGSASVRTRIESEHLPKRISYSLMYHRAR